HRRPRRLPREPRQPRDHGARRPRVRRRLHRSVTSMGKRRAVVVRGVRTPFVKAFGKLLKVDTIGLRVSAVGSLLEKTELDRKELDGIVWGGVILPGLAPNVGREI